MIALACDHGALELKEAIKAHLDEKGLSYKDFGTNSTDSCNYAVYGELVARAVASGECERGIAICGTGVGISIACNKVDGVRACVCSEPFSAKLSKQHNNSNVLCFGARVVGSELAKMIVDEWINAEFQGGRHQDRIDYIAGIERKNRV